MKCCECGKPNSNIALTRRVDGTIDVLCPKCYRIFREEGFLWSPEQRAQQHPHMVKP